MPDQVGRGTVVLVANVIVLLHQGLHATVRDDRSGVAIICEIALTQGKRKDDTCGFSDMRISEGIRHWASPSHLSHRHTRSRTGMLVGTSARALAA